MPNALAYAMLLAWPLVAWVLFQRLPKERAFVWTILGGYLILPPATAIDLPLIPSIDKLTIPNLSAFVLWLMATRGKVTLLPRSWAGRGMLGLFVFGVAATVFTNGHPITFQSIANSAPIDTTVRTVPALGLHELVSLVSAQVFAILPFVMARDLLASEAGRRELMRGLVVAGLVYTLPSLIEVRLSPQINVWVYGFFQHDFIQMMRDGGFRPIVFLPHALWLAFFLVSATLAATGLGKAAQGEERRKFLLATGWLMAVIVLCKSMAAIAYMAFLVPLLLLTGEKTRLKVALVMVLLALTYPTLRNYGLVPLDSIVSAAQDLSEERASSLKYRFDNEEILLEHAHAKPLFGWGGWGRNQVYDPTTGRSETVTDGRWIIVLGMFGLLGFVAEFGLLALPILMLWRRTRRLPAEDVGMGVGTLSLMLALTLIDMLINAPLVPYVWMIAGALLGQAEAPKERPVEVVAKADPGLDVLIGRKQPPGGPRTVL